MGPQCGHLSSGTAAGRGALTRARCGCKRAFTDQPEEFPHAACDGGTILTRIGQARAGKEAETQGPVNVQRRSRGVWILSQSPNHQAAAPLRPGALRAFPLAGPELVGLEIRPHDSAYGETTGVHSSSTLRPALNVCACTCVCVCICVRVCVCVEVQEYGACWARLNEWEAGCKESLSAQELSRSGQRGAVAGAMEKGWQLPGAHGGATGSSLLEKAQLSEHLQAVLAHPGAPPPCRVLRAQVDGGCGCLGYQLC